MLDEIPSGHLKIILDAVNLISPENAGRKEAIVEDAITRLGDRVSLLHMKDFRLAPGENRPVSVACGLGGMRYEALLAFARRDNLPMTVENTTPDNAEATRQLLERLADGLPPENSY